MNIKKNSKRLIKIGRYYYERIPQDTYGEPKLRDDEKDYEIYYLVNDGEMLEAFRRVRKSKSRVQKI